MSEGQAEPRLEQADRRDFLTVTSTFAMGGGLVAGYGSLAVMAGRFLYPSDAGPADWQFVARTADLTVGESIEYTAPAGTRVVVARQGPSDSAEDFIALSSICPHLGCRVHWEAQPGRFFCPCHNGAFDPQGRATEGPPAQAGQNLMQFPLKVEQTLLFIQVPGGTSD